MSLSFVVLTAGFEGSANNKKGEGISMEFKECRNKLNKDVFESICAFLNRNGGDLLLGVNDKGKITGIAPEAVERVKKELVTALNNPQKLNPPCYLMPEDVVRTAPSPNRCIAPA